MTFREVTKDAQHPWRSPATALTLDSLLRQANEGTLSKLCCEGRFGDRHLSATPGALTTF